MNSTEFNLASGGKTQGFLLASHPREGRLMKTYSIEPEQNPDSCACWFCQCGRRFPLGNSVRFEPASGRHRTGSRFNVGEPVNQWQVLRFRTQQEVSQFQSESAQAFIEDAATFSLNQEAYSLSRNIQTGNIGFLNPGYSRGTGV